MPTPWSQYLQPANAPALYGACRQRCRSSFDDQRANISRVFEATRPSGVACLGAGALNDIPYDVMVHAGARIHLVDWVPGSVDAGIDLSIIQTQKDGNPSCLYCRPPPTAPEQYCRNFERPEAGSSAVCKNFRPSAGCPTRCEAFERSDRPRVYYQDVTGGFADAFGRSVLGELHGVRSWRQALECATALVERLGPLQQTHVSIPDSSVDLVTSSMVVSQFEHEPYDYFARQVAEMLGPPAPGEERKLRSALESLRSTLLVNQVRRHCREIARILAPGGRCYMAFEIFHPVPNATHGFLVTGASQALETIGEHFHFNFDIIPEDRLLMRFETPDAPSLACSLVLEPKAVVSG